MITPFNSVSSSISNKAAAKRIPQVFPRDLATKVQKQSHPELKIGAISLEVPDHVSGVTPHEMAADKYIRQD